MGFFDFFRRENIDQGVEAFQAAPGGVLLDVRTPGEFAQGHIPGSVNLDVSEIAQAAERFPQKDTPLFVYCHSGARSGQAVMMLRQMGYTNAVNIGGIMDYHGQIER